MKLEAVNNISKLYFGYEEIARALNISYASAKVSASRYVKKNILVRLKRNVYVLKSRWDSLSREEFFQLANILQVPSYISLLTALDFFGITTQVQRNTVESISLKRTEEYDVRDRMFMYTRISEKIYGGFDRDRGFFIASAEKAFLDAVYLWTISRYGFDLTALDLTKLDREKTDSILNIYPDRVKNKVKKIWKS